MSQGHSQRRGTILRHARAMLIAALALASVLAAAALASGGQLDTGFSDDGKRTLSFGPMAPASDVAVDAQGRAVVTGRGQTGGSSAFTIVRLRANGSFDTSFSGDGRRFTLFPGTAGSATSDLTIDGQGRIVAVGVAALESGGALWAIARFHPDGSLDTTFSGDGRRLVAFGGYYPTAYAVTLDAQGRIVIAGSVPGSAAMGFARLLPDGSLDAAFSGDGKRTVQVGGPNGDHATGVDVADGRIVAVGSGDSNSFVALRLLASGALDSSFSDDGKRIVAFDGNFESATGIAAHGDGRFVAVGQATNRIAIVRFRPNGGLDDSFSGDGKRLISMGDFAGARDVVLQGTRIVAAGFLQVVGVPSFAIIRLLPTGDLDDTFSGDGKRAVSFPGWPHASAVAVASGQGRLTVAGAADNGGDEGGLVETWAVARLLAD